MVCRESLVVQVAGTGEGKSMLFILLAFCSLDRVIVVVVLLVALRDNLYSQCRYSRIKAYV